MIRQVVGIKLQFCHQWTSFNEKKRTNEKSHASACYSIKTSGGWVTRNMGTGLEAYKFKMSTNHFF